MTDAATTMMSVVAEEKGLEHDPDDAADAPPPAVEAYISSFLDDFEDEWERDAKGRGPVKNNNNTTQRTTTPTTTKKKKRRIKLRCNECRLQMSSCTCRRHHDAPPESAPPPRRMMTSRDEENAHRCSTCRLRASSCVCHHHHHHHDDDDDNNNDDVSRENAARQLELLTATFHSSGDGMATYEDDSRDGMSSSLEDGGVSMKDAFGLHRQDRMPPQHDENDDQASSSPRQARDHGSSSPLDRSYRSVTSIQSGSHDSIYSGGGGGNHVSRRLEALTRSLHSTDGGGGGITPYEDDHQYHHHHEDDDEDDDDTDPHDNGNIRRNTTTFYGQDSFLGQEDADNNNNTGVFDDSFFITDEENGYHDVYAGEGYDENNGLGLQRSPLSPRHNQHRHNSGGHYNHPGKAYMSNVDEMGETDILDDHDDHGDDDMSVHSYDRRRKWLPYVLFCGACLALVLGVGVGAGLGVALTMSGGGDDEETAGRDGDDVRSDLPPPTSDRGDPDDTAPTVTPTLAPTATSWIELGEMGNTTETNLFLGTESFDGFGRSVVLSGDGYVMAVGALNGGTDNRGSVQVFRYDDVASSDTWERVDRALTGRRSGDEFGAAVALSHDGQTVAVGAPRSDGTGGSDAGVVRVFRLSSAGRWEQLGQDVEGRFDRHLFGCSLDLSADSAILAVGSCQDSNGQTSVYRYDGTRDRWDDYGDAITGRGSTVALSGDGTTLAASAVGLVQAYRYLDAASSWRPVGPKLAGDPVGAPVALSTDGDRIVVGRDGFVQVYELRRDDWSRLGQALVGTAANDGFGSAVALSSDGNIVAVGALHSGDGINEEVGQVSLFKYTRTTNSWEPFGKRLYGEKEGENFGVSVAVNDDGTIVATGAIADIDEDTPDSGRVYVWQIDL